VKDLHTGLPATGAPAWVADGPTKDKALKRAMANSGVKVVKL
jgi:hypothetical protein